MPVVHAKLSNMNDKFELKTVLMTISPDVRSQEGKFHIKFERDIVQIISCAAFSFSSTSLNVAVTKVADLVARHPENYFSEINIR